MNRKVKIILALAGFLINFPFINAQQSYIGDYTSQEQIFIARIKQFSEFIDRFNYKIDFEGNNINTVFSDKYPRNRYLEHLFNRSVFDESDSIIVFRDEFIKDITDHNYSIYKYSSDITAIAKTSIRFRGEKEYINILLRQEIVGEDMVKWVISGVEGDILNVMKEDSTYIRFISPSSNETNFINLRRALEDKNHLDAYAYSGYEFDLLSVFFFCINQNIIEFIQIEKLSYLITDIPGWSFTVEEINRQGFNSGWLISDLSRSEK